jgi:hypothetical protein
VIAALPDSSRPAGNHDELPALKGRGASLKLRPKNAYIKAGCPFRETPALIPVERKIYACFNAFRLKAYSKLYGGGGGGGGVWIKKKKIF